LSSALCDHVPNSTALISFNSNENHQTHKFCGCNNFCNTPDDEKQILTRIFPPFLSPFSDNLTNTSLTNFALAEDAQKHVTRITSSFADFSKGSSDVYIDSPVPRDREWRFEVVMREEGEWRK
jgi:hypothetical protein